jgi:XRE family transcriptional regulator, regulator of sulfur utilization
MKLNPAALRVIRERTGLSKAELADRAGIDRTLVTRLENGERTGTPAVIVKLAGALQCSQLAICSMDADVEAVA